MARRRYYGRRRRGRRSNKLPVISLAILAGQVMGAYYAGGGNLQIGLAKFTSYYTGYDFMFNNWKADRLLIGYGPWLAKKFIGAIARPRVKGLPISLS